ncbi:MAG: Grx4 family monothiol glutaredoxin [Bdellovibrionales bacterium]|nr:Grx4 family monothiol glutaredoxin [Bdellovibrionales bacterium]
MGAKETISQLIENHPVLLFMKGEPGMPQCGFSARVVQILDFLKVKYHTFDVLSDEEVRQGIKEYSNWPTIPQLYVGKQFVGGCDIVQEQFETGELEKTLESYKS